MSGIYDCLTHLGLRNQSMSEIKGLVNGGVYNFEIVVRRYGVSIYSDRSIQGKISFSTTKDKIEWNGSSKELTIISSGHPPFNISFFHDE